MNAVYLFYNAAVQGTAAMLTAMKSRKVQAVLGAAIVTGALLELLNAMSARRPAADPCRTSPRY